VVAYFMAVHVLIIANLVALFSVTRSFKAPLLSPVLVLIVKMGAAFDDFRPPPAARFSRGARFRGRHVIFGLD
jgi:hypothetical protein